MSTVLEYNGIQLTGVRTRHFDQTCQYTNDGADLLFHRFDIIVEGMVTSLDSGPQYTTGPSGSNTTVERFKAIENRLMQPRKELAFRIGASMNATTSQWEGGDALLSFKPAQPLSGSSRNEWADADNGPKPQSLRIIRVVGSGVLWVEYHITAAWPLCKDDSADAREAVPAVLSNRWSVEDSRDQNFYTTRTVRGLLRLTNVQDFNAQDFRGWCIPSLGGGYRRESIDFTTSSNQLELEYVIVDKQTHAAPPFPATSWTCVHGAISPDGYKTIETLTLMLKGEPLVKNQELVAAAASVLNELMLKPNPGFKTGKGSFLRNISLHNHIHDSVVELRAELWRQDDTKESIVPGMLSRIGSPLDSANYNPLKSPHPDKGYEPTVITGAFLQYLQSPCNDDHRIRSGSGTIENVNKEDGPSVRYFTREGPETSTYSNRYVPDHKNFPYTAYEVYTSYESNEMKVALPIAAKIDGTSTDDTVSVVSLARTVAKVRKRIIAERLGKPPDMQNALSPPTVGPTQTLLSSTFKPQNPELLPDGKTYLYRISQEIVYSLAQEPGSTELLMGTSPHEKSTLATNVFPENAIVEGIV